MRLSLTISFTFAFLLGGSSGSAIVSIFLSHYENPRGQDDCGFYCDSSSLCDHYFIVCLDEVSGSSSDMDQCQFGRYRTGTIFNKNKIKFKFERNIGNTPNPEELHFHRWPGSVLVKVQVWDYDEYNKDDFVELLTKAVRIKTMMVYKSFTVKKITKLRFEMAVFCDENWYGPHCDIYCNPSFENYNCKPDGRKACYPGWRGKNCTKCGSGSCYKPGGNCVYRFDGYNCECQPGYTGLACDDEIDDHDTYDNEIDDNENDCTFNPCANGGSCLDGTGSYQCHCPYGYTGSTCEVEIGECASNPCDNNATCVDEIGQFRCHCPIGYEGPTCETEIDECASNPCDNDATCVDEIVQFRCLCPDGYTGPTCKADIDECAGQPCGNHATCVDLIGQFQCLCPIGYSGFTCETQTDAGSCTSCDSEVKGSHTSQTAKVSGITVTVVVSIVFAIVTLLIIWKIKQKRQAQQNEQLNGDYRISHEEAMVYYIAEPVQQRHLTEENIYQNSIGGDTQSTDAVLYGNSAYGTGPENVYGNASVVHVHETQADAENGTLIIDNPVYNTGAANMHASTQSNTRGNTCTPSGGEVDTVEYTNAICVKNTGDVYAVMNK